jgi:hypothetical protein
MPIPRLAATPSARLVLVQGRERGSIEQESAAAWKITPKHARTHHASETGGDMTQSKLGHRPRVLLHPGTRKRGYSGREDPRHIPDWRNNKKQHIWPAEDSGPVPQGHACCWDLTRWASSAPILQRKAHSTAQGEGRLLSGPSLKSCSTRSWGGRIESTLHSPLSGDADSPAEGGYCCMFVSLQESARSNVVLPRISPLNLVLSTPAAYRSR